MISQTSQAPGVSGAVLADTAMAATGVRADALIPPRRMLNAFIASVSVTALVFVTLGALFAALVGFLADFMGLPMSVVAGAAGLVGFVALLGSLRLGLTVWRVEMQASF